MTRFEIVQIGCTRNNTIHVAYVHCNYKESNSDWIRIFLGYLKLFTISIRHKTTFKHFLKNFDRVTGVHQSCSLRCGHTMQFLNPIFLPIFWSILISTKSYGVSTEVKSEKKAKSESRFKMWIALNFISTFLREYIDVTMTFFRKKS